MQHNKSNKNKDINTSELEEQYGVNHVTSYQVGGQCCCESCTKQHIYWVHGATGPTGPQGPMNGPTGPTGSIGPTGATGLGEQNKIFYRSSVIKCSTTSSQYLTIASTLWSVSESGFYQITFSSQGSISLIGGVGYCAIYVNNIKIPESEKKIQSTDLHNINIVSCGQLEVDDIVSVKFKYQKPTNYMLNQGSFLLGSWSFSLIKGISF